MPTEPGVPVDQANDATSNKIRVQEKPSLNTRKPGVRDIEGFHKDGSVKKSGNLSSLERKM